MRPTFFNLVFNRMSQVWVKTQGLSVLWGLATRRAKIQVNDDWFGNKKLLSFLAENEAHYETETFYSLHIYMLYNNNQLQHRHIYILFLSLHCSLTSCLETFNGDADPSNLLSLASTCVSPKMLNASRVDSCSIHNAHPSNWVSHSSLSP